MEASLAPQPEDVIVDPAPAQRPGPVELTGRLCAIVKLNAKAHADSLWRAVRGDETLWRYLAYGPFADRDSFREWVEQRAALSDPFSYAVIDLVRNDAVGIVTLMEIRPAMRVIEVGSIVYGIPLRRTPAATEAQYLIARYIFETLGYRRYEWKCNALNAPSRRAALRLGFAFEGVFRQHMIVKGHNRDTAWYSMLDREWPARKASLERWLSPDNFDQAGRQRLSLAEMNAVSIQG